MNPKPTGFSFPPSFQQVLSYLLILHWTSTFYIFLMPYQQLPAIIGLSVLYFIILMILFFYAYKITKSNPTDPYVFKFKLAQQLNTAFLEEFSNFCALCSSPVQDSSKHCMVCYRCVHGFDHHCTWVNNCIGKTNYKEFMKMIVSLEILLIVNLAVGAKCLNDIFDSQGNYKDFFHSNYGSDNSDIGYGFIMSSVLSCGLVGLLNGYLVCFHFWLIYKGITTFQYLTRGKTHVSSAEKTDDVKVDPELASLNPEKDLNINK